jgi:outer membrane receptor protein involved in Fe transport
MGRDLVPCMRANCTRRIPLPGYAGQAGDGLAHAFQAASHSTFAIAGVASLSLAHGTSIHAGYARYFTPPFQAQAATANLALFTNTTNQPEVPLADPVKPERSNYYDIGIDQKVLPGLDMGLDVYYKDARDLIDDGQFGRAVVLTQFNWARGYSEGGEVEAKYTNGNFYAYANFAVNVTRAIGPESNQYLLDADEYNYLLTHGHYTDDMQLMTGSGGAWYRAKTPIPLPSRSS